jgi:HEPN domain-containing protein
VLATDKQVHIVILFGSYATGKWVADIYAEEGTTYSYYSDYDILVITPTENFSTRLRVGEAIKQRCVDNGRIRTSINTIFHGIHHVNNALLYGNYFFADIKKEGILLFDSGKYKLAEPKVLAPEELRCKMQENFEQWFGSALNAFRKYEYSLKENMFFEAAFDLHQVTERFYTTILLTYTDYRPKEHNLRELDIKAQAEDARFAEAFPKETEEQKDRFELLVRAYIDARYRMKQYHITKDDLEYLGQRVLALKELTEKLCRERIDSIK